MSSQSEGASSSTFGPNAWLVDDMYEQYREDPNSVSESWREFFEGYRPGGANLARPSTPDAADADGTRAPAVATPPANGPTDTSTPAEQRSSADGAASRPAAASTAGAHAGENSPVGA